MTNEEFIGKTPTPEALIRLSIKHLEEAERNPKYRIDMSQWFYKEDGKCFVCFGAATLVLGLGREKVGDIRAIRPLSVRERIYALDAFRQGWITLALKRLGCWKPYAPNEDWIDLGLHRDYRLPVYLYHSDAPEFKRRLLKLADLLEGYKLLINTAGVKS